MIIITLGQWLEGFSWNENSYVFGRVANHYSHHLLLECRVHTSHLQRIEADINSQCVLAVLTQHGLAQVQFVLIRLSVRLDSKMIYGQRLLLLMWIKWEQFNAELKPNWHRFICQSEHRHFNRFGSNSYSGICFRFTFSVNTAYALVVRFCTPVHHIICTDIQTSASRTCYTFM
jgi:hypothetical protein